MGILVSLPKTCVSRSSPLSAKAMASLVEKIKGLKLGPGLISKGTWAFGVFEVVLGTMFIAVNDVAMRWTILGLMAVAYPIYFVGNYVVVKCFPAHSLLEGAQLLDFLGWTQGVKGLPHVENTPAIEGTAFPPLPSQRTENQQ